MSTVLFALHYVHLTADFPNRSRWMDWSKYTDEGWYGDAAIRLYQRGSWYVAGDFNPAAALPVLPAAEALVFHFSGVSVTAARALSVSLFGGTLLAAFLLVRRRGVPPGSLRTLPAAAAVLLLAANPFCFVFTRLAIIEPLLVLEMLLALLAAGALVLNGAGEGSWEHSLKTTLRQNAVPMLALGLLLPAMVLTKTTAVFLMPALAWRIVAAAGYRVRASLRLGLPPALLGAVLWVAYYALLVRPRYLLDYRYLFSANAYTGITRATFFPVLAQTVEDGMWMGRLLYPAAWVAIAVALLSVRRLRGLPFISVLLLWAFGYAAFLAYHDNLQPRYYLVVAVPLTLLVPVVLADLVLPVFRAQRAPLLCAGALVLAIAVLDAREMLRYIRHPEYTFLDAARQVRDVIAAGEQTDPTHNPLVLSISGSDLSLMTGLHSICDDFGTLELADRVKLYRPGWYVAWNQIDDDKMDAMTPLFHIERVAAFPAFDDPDRNLLIVYRLDPSIQTPPSRRKRKPTPRRLVTRVGQQPSTEQLEH